MTTSRRNDANQPSATSLAVGGDITALTIVDLPCGLDYKYTLLLASIGSQIHAFSLPSGRPLFTQTVLPDGVRAHGIVEAQPSSSLPSNRSPAVKPSAHTDTPRAATPCEGAIVAVHGGRFASLHLLMSTGLRPLARTLRLRHWSMTARCALLHSPDNTNHRVLLAIVLSDNSLELYLAENATPTNGTTKNGESKGESTLQLVSRIECADRCLLYSADLWLRVSIRDASNRSDDSLTLPNSRDASIVQCLVSAGTILHDVAVWSTSVCIAPALSGFGADGPARRRAINSECRDETCSTVVVVVPVALRLKGHVGSIHTVTWSHDGRVLVSGSDDRTLRVWDIPSRYLPECTDASDGGTHACGATTRKQTMIHEDDDGGKEERRLVPRHVLYGHLARLWCAAYSDESIMASASEDGSCRLWDVRTGADLATIKAHRFRGVWHCIIRGTTLYTAGADGTVKLWNLWDWLPPPYAKRLFQQYDTDQHMGGQQPERKARDECDVVAPATAPYQPRAPQYLACPWQTFTLRGRLPDAAETAIGTTFVVQAGTPSVDTTTSNCEHATKCDTIQSNMAALNGCPTNVDGRCHAHAAGTSMNSTSSCQFTATPRDMANQTPETSAIAKTTNNGSAPAVKAAPWHPIDYGPPKQADGTTAMVDSRLERPRCLALSKDGRFLFVSTNRGLIHRVELPSHEPIDTMHSFQTDCAHETNKHVRGVERWTTVYKSKVRSPIVSMSLQEEESEMATGEQRNGSGSGSGCDERRCFLGAANITGDAVCVGVTSPCLYGGTEEQNVGDATDRKDALNVVEWRPFGSEPALGVFFAEGLTLKELGSNEKIVFVPGPQGQLAMYAIVQTCWQRKPTHTHASGEHQQQPQHHHKPSYNDDDEDTSPEKLSRASSQHRNNEPIRLASASCMIKSRVVTVRACGASYGGQRRPPPAAAAAAAASSSMHSQEGSVALEKGHADHCEESRWVLVTGASCGSMTVWSLRIQFKPRTAVTGYESITSCNATLEPLTYVKGGKIRTALRCLAVYWTCGPKGHRIEIERGTTAGSVERFGFIYEKQGQTTRARLVRLGERRCESIGIVAGATFLDHTAARGRRDSHGSGGSTHSRSPAKVASTSSRASLIWGFETTNFVVYDEKAEAEVCLAYVCSWKKPWAAMVKASDDMTLCFALLDTIHVYRRTPTTVAPARSSSNSNEKIASEDYAEDNFGKLQLPRALMPPSHGSEINAIRLLPLASSPPFACQQSGIRSAGIAVGGDKRNAHEEGALSERFLACVTGGEDAWVKQACILTQSTSADVPHHHCHSSMLRCTDAIGHTFGAAVKSIAIAPLIQDIPSTSAGGSASSCEAWIVVAGCAKQTLVAWIVARSRSETGSKERGRIIGERLGPVHAPTECTANDNGMANGRSNNTASLQQLDASNAKLRCMAIDLVAVVSQPRYPKAPVRDIRYRNRISSSSSSSSSPHAASAFNSADNSARCSEAFFAVPLYLALTASSDGSMELLAVPSYAHQPAASPPDGVGAWPVVAKLERQPAPVLTLKCVHVLGADRHVAFAGRTDGSLTVWDLTPCVVMVVDPRQQCILPTLRCALEVPHMHQSGMNALSVACLDSNRVVVATAGDDQAICVSVLAFTNATDATTRAGESESVACSVRVEVICTTVRHCAHSSAVRGVWTDGRVVFSVGLDQKLRRWEIAAEFLTSRQQAACGDIAETSQPATESSMGEIEGDENVTSAGNAIEKPSLRLCETGWMHVEVLEPSALDVVSRGDGVENTRSRPAGFDIAVAGKGLQVLEWT